LGIKYNFQDPTAMNNKTTIESATAEIEEETGSFLQLSFSRAPKKNHDALAELEKQFVHWRMLSPRIEEEAAGRMGLLTELSKEIGRGGQLHE
jgi:phage-related minor tail protein